MEVYRQGRSPMVENSVTGSSLQGFLENAPQWQYLAVIHSEVITKETVMVREEKTNPN